VENLAIPLAGIPEQGYHIDTLLSAKDLQPEGAEGLPLSSVRLSGTISAVDSEYLFQGRLQGTFSRPCDRCLEEAQVPFDIEIVWCFEEGAPSEVAGKEAPEHEVNFAESEERRTFQGNEIDLSPHVWEELVFALPVKFICREDCRGLCPSCGANRNTTSCNCPASATENSAANRGLAGLAELFPDLARMKPKE